MAGKSMKRSLFLITAFIILMGCANSAPQTKAENLRNGISGALSVIQADSEVFQKASVSNLSPVTKAVYIATINKANILRGLEKEIGNGYKVQDGLLIGNINQLCWMGRFLQVYKKHLPADIDYNDLYTWIDVRKNEWLSILNKELRSNHLKDDCRI